MKPFLVTDYLGLSLKNPLMVGASPLADSLDMVRQLEDAGASAIVIHSLFEEQLAFNRMAIETHTEMHEESFSEATSYLPDTSDFTFGPEEYLGQIVRMKKALDIPVIGSLNGVTQGGWTRYARLMEQAGADALELNFYYVPTSLDEDAAAVEERLLEVVSAVRSRVRIPLAVKLSPFFSAFANLAHRLRMAGADGLVLFNRFYQPDIDIELLETVPRLNLSDSSELLLRLRWLAILHGKVDLDLAVSGGVHDALGAIKALMTGADAVQLVSLLLKSGPDSLARMLDEMNQWLEEHEYDSIEGLRGSMSLFRCPDPSAFERGNYMRILQGWRV